MRKKRLRIVSLAWFLFFDVVGGRSGGGGVPSGLFYSHISVGGALVLDLAVFFGRGTRWQTNGHDCYKTK